MPPEGATLREGAQALGLALTDAQCEKLLAYQALILKWNRVYNLTAIRDPAEMLTHHLLDSLAVMAPLTVWQAKKESGESPRLLDVGSGAGLPGAVIAVMAPAIKVTCVDTVGKKASFIRQTASELSLGNLSAEHARVESLKLPPFDLVTSRAFASLVDFVSLTRTSLKAGGEWMAMKGKVPMDEIQALPADVEVFHVEQLSVPGLNAERCLVWMRRKS